MTPPILLLSSALITGVILTTVFMFRERRIIKNYGRLKDELGQRMREIGEKEKKISKQNKNLQKQIELSEEQNALIHKQTIELEKSRHSLERTVELRTNELVVAKEKAEESDRLKTAFLENISHEIRTPMNAIMGFGSLLVYPDITPDEREKYISRITNNCNMLLHLIDGIIDMSKIQAGQMTIVNSVFSVNNLFENLYEDLVASHKELEIRDLKIEMILPKENADFILYTDQFRLKQIMQNLLSNATKYTEAGSIKFGYIPLFDSDYDKEPSKLQFFVEDTGIGISPQKSEYIFNWFNKIEEDTSKVYRGAGLGLYLSKELVELIGGRMWFNSKVKEGSTFYFTLHYMNTSDTNSPKIDKIVRKKKDSVQSFDWQKKAILIVEDEQSNIIYLSEIIKRTGAKIVEATTGQRAIEIIEEGQDISLILMDLMMPEMDGYEATRRIKKKKPQIPIIAQTAYTNAREKEKSLEAGCDGYISKPYNPPELLKLISNFI